MKKKLISLVFLFFYNTIIYAQIKTIKQVNDSAFVITTTTIQPNEKIFWNSKPDSWKNEQKLFLKFKSDTVLIPCNHPILKEIISKNEKPFYISTREIKLNGANNFRDLGGYTTNDGRMVKWGKIYRSAEISKLSDKDLKIISSLNIKTVCDLRGEKEAANSPDRLPEGTDRIVLGSGSENITGKPGDYAKYMKTPEMADSLIRSFYTRTDHLKAKYKPMFEKLLALEPDKALMFHCTAGKDRTGVGAALILYALGVSEMDILQDYEATNEFRKAYNEKYIGAMVSQGVDEKAAHSLMDAKSEYLMAAYEAINKKFGSINNFLEKEIGLTKEKKALLQSKFLY